MLDPMPDRHEPDPGSAVAERDPAGNLTLRGTACVTCGYRAFPAQDLGCERCGAHGDALSVARLAGTGTITAAAVVHRHDGPEITAPFTAAAIVLDDGPFVHALLDGSADAAPAPGTRVRAVAAGGDLADVRFAPEEATR